MNRLHKILLPICSLGVAYGAYFCVSESKSLTSKRPEAAKGASNFKFKTRQQHLTEIEKDPNYDIVIIGGGCNGVGVLLDASTRGFKTLLIQKDDFASGASSKSTKLIHGGVRYLEQVFALTFDSISSRLEKFHLVKQAISERSLMIDSAPHLTNVIPFVIPCQNAFWSMYYYLGSVVYYCIYHLYSPKTKSLFHFPYFVNSLDLKEIFPYISLKYNSGVVYEDGSFNDARLLISAILTATLGNNIKMPETFKPANVLNKAELVDFIKDEYGRIQGVIILDRITGKTMKVKAKYVVNCTGVWADTIRLKDSPYVKKKICIVGGSHITYSQNITNSKYGLCLPSSDGRVILVVPWQGRTIAGTTEKKYDEPTNNPICSDDQRKFINQAMKETMADMDYDTFFKCQISRWSGLRPLVVSDASKSTKDIARSHVIEVSESGLLSLMGGKWTIYRKMGEDLVDEICVKERRQQKVYPGSQTKGLELIGTADENAKQQLFESYGGTGAHLYRNYGSNAFEIVKGDLTPLCGPITKAELEWIIKNQLVNDIEDVLMRRTRSTFLFGKKDALQLIPHIAAIFQKEKKLTKSATSKLIEEAAQKILQYEFE